MEGVEALTSALNSFVAKLSEQTGVTGGTSQPNLTNILSTHNIQFETFDDKKEPFETYQQRLENYFALKQLDKDTEECKTAKTRIMLNSVGTKYFQLLTSLTTPKKVTEFTYIELMELLQSHLNPARNIYIEQHKFLSRMQAPAESLLEFIAALTHLSISCKFVCPHDACKKSISEVFLRSQFIRGLKDPHIREKILQSTVDSKETLTFEKVCELALALDTSKQGNQEFKSSAPTSVNKVHAKNSTTKNSYHANRFNKSKSKDDTGRRDRKPNQSSQNRLSGYRPRPNLKQLGLEGLCLRCGVNNHRSSECQRKPESLLCSKCSKTGHVERVCITTTLRNTQKGNIYNIDLEGYSNYNYEEEDEYYSNINRISQLAETDNNYDHKFYATVLINNIPLKFEVDTGSPVTLIPLRVFTKLNFKKLYKSHDRFRSYTGEMFTPLGAVYTTVHYRRSQHKLKM